MAEESVFRGVITFLDKIGVYDIILPFLLVFTIVFAVLEKTKVLGLEKIDGKDYTKKNLNAMVAFVTSFLVIASTQLVSVINQMMANVVLLLILGVCFLMLVGVFFGDKEFTFKDIPTWTKIFTIIMFIGLAVIFLNAMDWLQYVFAVFEYWNEEWAAGIIMLVVLLGFIIYVTRDSSLPKKESSEKK
ncbi:hypothetical protein HZC30_01125 [Candidatus Woesearchaeota archaeon]|nr:hypothetical protein [Candidatus Woesearchaeota archaeon]